MGGIYRVIDVYPSGKRVLRGEAPFGQKSIQPRTNGGPPTRKYVWLSGPQALYTYLGFLESGPSTGFSNMLLVISNESDTYTTNLTVRDSWDLQIGCASYAASIDHGFDGDEDLILPDTYNRPFIYSIFNKETLHSFSGFDYSSAICVAVGNLDDDFADEIVFIRNESYSKLYIDVFDDWKNSYSKLASIDVTSYISDYTDPSSYKYSFGLTSLVLSDVDLDDRMEIVVGFTAVMSGSSMGISVAIYDDSNANFEKIDSVSEVRDQLICQETSIVASDLDSDNNTEIVYASTFLYYYRYNASSKKLYFIDKLKAGDNYVEASHYVDMHGEDVDMDFMDELIVGFNTLDYANMYIMNLNSTNTVSYRPISIRLAPSRNVYISIGIGDFDGDNYKELTLAYTSPYGTNDVYLYFYDDYLTDYKITASLTATKSGSFPAKPITIPISLTGKVLIKYTGIHNVSTSQPYIIAVMMAPPTIDGIAQNYDDTATMFGTAVSKTTTESNGYAISTGVTLSYEREDVFKIVDIHASVTFMYEFEKTHTISQTITECREFSGDYENDYVIFESILYDNYYYEIVIHPNQSFVGEKIAISIPNEPAVYKWTVQYFNENNGDYPDIGPETYNHTTGKVWTYPNRSYVDTIKRKYGEIGFWRSDGTMTVGSGGGVNSIEIDLEKEETTEISRTVGVEFEAGFAIAGVGLSASVGISSKYVYSISVGEATKYRGDVGDIDEAYYATYRYSVGLFVYNFYREEDYLAYQIVNYWVEDYKGPKEIPTLERLAANKILSKIVLPISRATGLDPGKALIVTIALPTIGIPMIYLFFKGKLTSKKKTRQRKRK